MMIKFNQPLRTGREEAHIQALLHSTEPMSDGGPHNDWCTHWLMEHHQAEMAYLTSSCTSALEMAAHLLDVQPGDEVILPSFTYVSTAAAFVLRGARPVFVDINPDTLCIDVSRLEEAISLRTRVIIPVHYGGWTCEMEQLLEIAETKKIKVIEDAAHGITASYKNRPLGSMGQIGVLSFHQTKNLHCGEGGALLLNDESLLERAELLKEKGTNRKAFLKGHKDSYTWQMPSPPFQISELQAAYLRAQFERADTVIRYRRDLWDYYRNQLTAISKQSFFRLPEPLGDSRHNGHIMPIICEGQEQSHALRMHFNSQGVEALSHYQPLHLSPAGKTHGRFSGDDVYTSKIAASLVRLPLHFHMTFREIDRVCEILEQFGKK